MPKLCGAGTSVTVNFASYGLREFAFDTVGEASNFADLIMKGHLPFPTTHGERVKLQQHPADSVQVKHRSQSTSVPSGTSCPSPDYSLSASRTVGKNRYGQLVPLSPWTSTTSGAMSGFSGSCGCW